MPPIKYIRPIEKDEGSFIFEDRIKLWTYSGDSGYWVSEHLYSPERLWHTRSKVFSWKDSGLYLHNHGNYGEFYGVCYPWSIDVVMNMHAMVPKRFQSINWQTVVENKPASYSDTIKQIMVYNDYGCSGYNNLVYLENVRNLEGRWHFNGYRNLVSDVTKPFLDNNLEPIASNIDDTLAYYKRRRFIHDYLIVRFKDDNSDQQSKHLVSTGISYVPVTR